MVTKKELQRAKQEIRRSLLEELLETEGYESLDELCELYLYEDDTVVPAICRLCRTVYYYEPDQRAGWCENCMTHSVVSALVLAGLL